MAEFTNRLILKTEELPNELAIKFFNIVKNNGPEDIIQTLEDSVMVHYVQDDIHHYEVNLTRAITAEEGDPIAEALDNAMDYDFELEASANIETDITNGIK